MNQLGQRVHDRREGPTSENHTPRRVLPSLPTVVPLPELSFRSPLATLPFPQYEDHSELLDGVLACASRKALADLNRHVSSLKAKSALKMGARGSVLSPAEQDEVTRFGIHDEDVLRNMEEHWADDVPCNRCKSPATWVLICRGTCQQRGFVCAPCLEQVRAICALRLLRCVHCQIEADTPGLDAIVRVVEL